MKKIRYIVIPTLCVVFMLELIACQANNKGTDDVQISEELFASSTDGSYKHWVWARPNSDDTDVELVERYKKYNEAGIVGIFFEADSERHFRAAKAQGLQAHRWLWIMNRGDVLAQHPEWAAVNRNGESCATHPPYVDYYRWMCPSRTEVQEFLANDVEQILAKDYVDGIHFDYIRYSDGILAVNLWENYGIVQTQELPEYDFCYCDVCKATFKEKYGKNIDEIEYPQESLSWRAFRLDAVTDIANNLVKVAHKHNKPASAAVFPTPDVAKRLVKQDWTRWSLDAVFPMIYHGFYKEDISWIGRSVQEGMLGINNRFPLYAGLYIPDFANNEDLEVGIKYALDNGASGISIFGDVDDNILAILNKYKTK